MLVYLGTGQRRYDINPVEENRRKRWEFQAVIQGSIAPIFDGVQAPAQSRYLWLSHPDCLHGWTSTSKKAAEVIVFHFDLVPPALNSWVVTGSHVEQALTRKDTDTLRRLANVALEHSRAPTDLTGFYHDYIAHQVAELVLRSVSQRPLQNEATLARYRVEAARAWYEANLSQCPSLTDVADAVYLSPAHLRRMFKIATGVSMRDDLRALQTAHIEDLLLNTDWPLYRIAEACGYQNHEVFSRSFRQHHGLSPSEWRKRRTRVSHRDA
jgi:AraC-like DNA-binding protein